MNIKVKRVYEKTSKKDGVRVLVDRLWPRGVSKEGADLDEWLQDIGPSNDLRKWFNHDPDKFSEFKEKYQKELKRGDQADAFDKLKDIVQEADETVTLLFGARETRYNQAQVLKDLLK